jgi:DinB superfamily
MQRAGDLFDSLTDEQLQNEVAPGRNRGVYLLGHLVAVHDGMLPLLGFREQLYPELTVPFISEPDNASKKIPLIKDLRIYWKQINTALAEHFSSLQSDEWFQKHTAVSDENFIKESHRNNLNIIINRTNHLSYHLGQLAFLKK